MTILAKTFCFKAGQGGFFMDNNLKVRFDFSAFYGTISFMIRKTPSSHLKNLTVEEFTTPCVHFLNPESTVQQAEKIMNENSIRHLPVLDANKKIVGMVSEKDLYSSYRIQPNGGLSVQKIMKTEPYCTPAQTKIYEVALTMSKNKYGSAIILYDDESLGIFTSTDVLNALIEVVRGDF